jgi:tRNA pseudouridine38-40 synthase
MARYQVILSYDGTDFYGFQRQAKAVRNRTVQGVFELALRKLGWQGRAILSAGRTDTGVHAYGQVVAFDLDWAHSAEKLQAALNAALPADVVVRQVNSALSDFHPRYDALSRRYRYRIFYQPMRDPLRERFAWRVWPVATLGRMQQAADHLLGSHEFSHFGTPPRAGGTTVRDVFYAKWLEESEYIVFEIVANAFLFHMVRRLVSTLVSVGQGVAEADVIYRCLEDGIPLPVKGLAPPQGLTLMEVSYLV